MIWAWITLAVIAVCVAAFVCWCLCAISDRAGNDE